MLKVKKSPYTYWLAPARVGTAFAKIQKKHFVIARSAATHHIQAKYSSTGKRLAQRTHTVKKLSTKQQEFVFRRVGNEGEVDAWARGLLAGKDLNLAACGIGLLKLGNQRVCKV